MESEQKEEWDKDGAARKLGSTTVGSKSEVTASPLVGPERKKASTIPSVSEPSGLWQLGVVICGQEFSLKGFVLMFHNFKANRAFQEHAKRAKLLINAV